MVITNVVGKVTTGLQQAFSFLIRPFQLIYESITAQKITPEEVKPLPIEKPIWERPPIKFVVRPHQVVPDYFEAVGETVVEPVSKAVTEAGTKLVLTNPILLIGLLYLLRKERII